MNEDPRLALIAVLAPLSLVAIGGGSSVLSDIQNQVVEVHHWLDTEGFVRSFAIARAAPGPGSMLSTVIGWQVAGWSGALVATMAMFLPSSILCFFVLRLSHRFHGRAWHTAIQSGLAPVGGGLILASVLTIGRISLGSDLLEWAITGVTAAILWLFPKVSPLVLFALGAGIYIVAHRLGIQSPAGSQ